MRLIVVAGCRRDARPTVVAIFACGTESMVEAREPSERFRAHAYDLLEDSAEATLAHFEAGGDGAHICAG